MKLRRPAAVALVMASFVGLTLVGSTVFSSQILELTASLSTYRVNLAEKAKSFTGHSAQSGVLKRSVNSVGALQREFAKGKASDAEGPIRVVVESEQARGVSGLLEALRSALGPLEMLLLTLIYAAVLVAEQYDIFDRVVRLARVENITGSTSALRQDGQISESVRQEAEPPDAGFPDYKAGLSPGELKHLIGGISLAKRDLDFPSCFLLRAA